MVATSEQSNTRKRLTVTLNARFLVVSFNLALAGGESLAKITSQQTQRRERALIFLQFQNILQCFPCGSRFSDRRQYYVKSGSTFPNIYWVAPEPLSRPLK